jgi:hypothetical protein
MILEADSIKAFSENINRTDLLIEAVDKIKAYNKLYQNKTYFEDYNFGKMVEEIQDKQLEQIGISCSEHAIISLATTIENFCNELIQELLYKFPKFFQAQETKHKLRIRNLIKDKNEFDYEVITKKLGLNSRFDKYAFFKIFNLEFLTKEESNLMKYIILLRNSYVHNGTKIDNKTKTKLKFLVRPVNETLITTESKRLRTKIKRSIPKIYKRVITQIIL